MPAALSSRTFERLNYALRPAKQVERRMVVSALRRLDHFGPVSNYQYVGFGSVYFVDFSLVHRQLGVSHLTSIEHELDTYRQQRFMFNAPFGCVDVRFGRSNDVLPDLDWSRSSIVWLDYECSINADTLTDVATVAHVARSGSALIVTFNASPERPREDGRRSAVDIFFRRIPEDVRIAGLSDSDVNAQKMGNTIRRIVRARLDDTLERRNALLEPDERLRAEQVFFFEYRDGAPMMSVGFVLVARGHSDAFTKGHWQDLPYYRSGDEPFGIAAPVLTAKELRHLERQLPLTAGAELLGYGIPVEQLNAFAELYRYYPSYAEIVG